MVTLEWSCERSDGVTLVSLVVAADRPCRVRVENRLDGPVWPPRRRGQPAVGWDGDAFEGTVPAEGRLTVGYATPARPADPPAEVVSTEPADEPSASPDRRVVEAVPAVEPTPAGVVRDLGDPVVPRDGVPVPETGAAGAREGGDDARTDDDTRTERESRTDEEPRRAGTGRTVTDAQSAGSTPDLDRLVVPGAVRSWLRDVDRRFDAASGRTGERRDGSGSATRTGLGAAVAADRRALQGVRERIDGLLARADGGGVAGRTGERVGGDGRVDPEELARGERR